MDALREIHFRVALAPHEVQAQLEREFMAVLTPGREEDRLVYRASFTVNGAPYRARLRFDAALPKVNAYSLRLEMLGGELDPAHRDYHLKASAGWFDLWTRDLPPSKPMRPDEPQREDHRRVLEAEALAAEAQHTTVAELQRAILERMRRGASFSTAHKEGGTNLRFQHGSYVRQDYGESEARHVYADEAAFLSALRKFYEREVSRSAPSGKVTEETAWRLLLRLLRTDRPPGPGPGPGLGPGLGGGGMRRAFVIPALGLPPAVTWALLGLAVVGLGFYVLGNRLLTVRTTGSPFGLAVRTSEHVATLILRQEPYFPTLHRNVARDRYRLDLLLVPLSGNEPGKLVSLVRREPISRFQGSARLFGQDGDLLWLHTTELLAFNLKTHRVIGEKDLLAVNPTLGEWLSQAFAEFDGRLRLTTRDQRRSVVIDPSSLVAQPVEIVTKRGWVNPNFAPEDLLCAGGAPAPDEWLGVHSLEETNSTYKAGYLLPRDPECGKALSVRRLYSGRSKAENGRARLLSLQPLSETEYVGAALVRAQRQGPPLRLSGPDGYVMTHLSSRDREATVIVVRLGLDGQPVWRVDTGLGRLDQLLPDAERPAFIGRRPAVPNHVPEPLLITIDARTGTLASHSLWTKNL